MIGRACPQLAVTRAAAATGRWTDGARAHVETCGRCLEFARVTSALSASLPARPVVADAGRLWVQGRVARRLRAEAQVSRLSLLVHTVIGVAVAALLVYAASRLEISAALPRLELAVGALMVTGAFAAGVLLLSRADHKSTP